MKKVILNIAVCALITLGLQAQTNTFPASGNVGIGTTSPDTQLEVVAQAGHRLSEDVAKFSVSDAPGDYLIIGNATSINNQFIPGIRSSHTSDNRQALDFGAFIGASNDQGSEPIMRFVSRVSGSNSTPTTRPLFAWLGSNNDQYMTIDGNGYLGLGTTTPDELLTVKGTVHAQEVLVDLLGAVAPDYVFEKYYEGSSELNPEYEMSSLEEIEAYTREHHHLPGVPSAEQLEEEGYYLGEMNRILLEKVEELTLLLIEQDKRIKELEAK